MSKELYMQWRKEIDGLTKEILKRDVLLRQYALWLETSEENTKYTGEDVYHMLTGVLQGLSSVDFIPGVGWNNFVAVVGAVQKETKLDLGVCPYLIDNIDNSMKSLYFKSQNLSETGEVLSECGIAKDKGQRIFLSSLQQCLPPQRSRCHDRKAKLLVEMVLSSKNK